MASSSAGGANANSGPSFSAYASRFLSGSMIAGNMGRPSARDDADTPLFHSELPDPYTTSPPARKSRHRSPSRSSDASLPRLAGSRDVEADDDDGGGGAERPRLASTHGDTADSAMTLPNASGLLFVADGDALPQSKPPHPDVATIPSIDDEADTSAEEADVDLDLLNLDRHRLQSRPSKGKQPVRPPLADQPPTSSRRGRGWLAHQSIFPPSTSASSSPSSSVPRGYMEELDTDDESKPSDPASPPVKHHRQHQPPPQQRRYGESPSLSSDDEEGYGDDLDPPDYFSASTRDVGRRVVLDQSEGQDDMQDLQETIMSGVDIPRRLEVYHGRMGVWGEVRTAQKPLAKYKDAGFLALWLTSVLGVLIGLCFVWGATDPAPRPPSAPPSTPYRTPFATLLHTIPLLAVLTGIAMVLPMGFLFLLKKAVRPVLMATAIAIPFFLFLCSWWGFVASFESNPLSDTEPTASAWWGTTALRLFSLVPLVLAGLFGRMVWLRRERLERTVGVVELSAGFLLDHPPLLLLHPILLGALALLSLPYLTLLLRLLLIGYYRHPRENTYVWHVRPYADWLAVLVVVLWLWTWAVVRGVGRVVVAAVVGDWYFHREEPDRRPVLDTTVSALHRATGPSLGSICISGLIVAVVRIAGQVAARARRIVHPRANVLPSALSFLSALTPLFTAVASVLDQLNGYALVYVGIMGDPFWPSAKRAVRLAGRRKGGPGRLLDYTLIKLLLTLCSATLALFTAMAGYLFAVHALGAPSHAPLTALLCAFVPFLAFRAGAGVLGDASDSLFICYAIDREAGGQHSDLAAKAFSADVKPLDESLA